MLNIGIIAAKRKAWVCLSNVVSSTSRGSGHDDDDALGEIFSQAEESEGRLRHGAYFDSYV